MARSILVIGFCLVTVGLALGEKKPLPGARAAATLRKLAVSLKQMKHTRARRALGLTGPAPAPRKLDAHEKPNLVELAKAAGDFTVLLEAVEKTGLTESLATMELTVMAPNDKAFEGALEYLGVTKDMAFADLEMLEQVLKYHAVDKKVYSKDVTDGMEVATLQGEKFTVKMGERGAQICGGDIAPCANVIQADVEASNGVVHIIDMPLFPPTVSNTLKGMGLPMGGGGGGGDWGAACFEHCPDITKLADLESDLDGATWAESQKTVCENAEVTTVLDCIMDKCATDDNIKNMHAFQETAVGIASLTCGCTCADFGTIMFDVMADESSSDTKKMEGACPIYPAAVKCVEAEAKCKAVQDLPGGDESQMMMRMGCLGHEAGCKMEGAGSVEAASEKHPDIDAKCNTPAMQGADVPAECCGLMDAFTADVEGGKKCMDLWLGMAAQDPNIAEVVDKWNAACPDQVMSSAAAKTYIEDTPLEAEKEAEKAEEGAADAAMPRAKAYFSAVFVLLAFVLSAR